MGRRALNGVFFDRRNWRPTAFFLTLLPALALAPFALLEFTATANLLAAGGDLWPKAWGTTCVCIVSLNCVLGIHSMGMDLLFRNHPHMLRRLWVQESVGLMLK